jgi:16S rRNA (cytosine1407-C5)-methyltransferase
MMAKKKVPVIETKVDPNEVLARYRVLVPQETYACILEELDQPLPQGLRTNQLQTTTSEVVKGWQAKYGWELHPVPFCDNGWQVISATKPPSQTLEHLMGAYYIQEASSMLPPELFEYDSDIPELVLDLAASPGGKTTHLVDKMSDRGLVIANDASRSRIQALRLALERWGAINVAIACQPGELFGAWFPGMFDKVLIDAPCSMEGLRTAESHPMRPVTGRERDSLASRQVRLLVSALRAVRTGGQVVYSTCTLAPEEDEAVLLAVKQRFGTAVEIVNSRMTVNAPALQLPEAGQFPEISRALRIWPHLYNTAGFFTALIRKNDSFDEKSGNHPPHRSWEHQGWTQQNSRAVRELASAFKDQFGFDLEVMIANQELSFWKRDGRIQAVPELFLSRFGYFPVVACGLELGSMIGGSLQPSHEWAARFSGQFTGGRMMVPDDQLAIWLRGSDVHIPVASGLPPGREVCLFTEAGQFAGLGKILAGRVKNQLPRRLVA